MRKAQRKHKATLSPEEIEDIVSFFHANGLVFSDWAKERGFHPMLIYHIINNRRKCLRGKGFQAAIQLKEFALQSA